MSLPLRLLEFVLPQTFLPRYTWSRYLTRGAIVSPKADILNPVAIRLGRKTYVDDYVLLDATLGKIIIGDSTYVLRGAIVSAIGNVIRIGSKTSINPYCILYGCGGLTIGNNVQFAAGCITATPNHGRDYLGIEESAKGITVEDDVWLGAGTTILDGVTIGRGAVVGAGSVVTKNVKPYSLVAGCPAELVRQGTIDDLLLK